MEWSYRDIVLLTLLILILISVNFLFNTSKFSDTEHFSINNISLEVEKRLHREHVADELKKKNPSNNNDNNNKKSSNPWAEQDASFSEEWLEYAKLKNCTLDPFYYSQIDKDLEIFRNLRNATHPRPITWDMLITPKRELDMVTIITWEENKIYADTDYFLHSEDYTLFEQLAPYMPVGLSFVINHHDATQLLKNSTKFYPVFSACKTPQFIDIVFPSFLHYYGHCHIDQTQVIPWESPSKNNDTVFWRGSTTGKLWKTVEQFTQSPRFQLVEWGRNITNDPTKYPFKADIGFTAFYQFVVPGVEPIARQLTIEKPGIACTSNQNYKYLIIADGNSWVQRFFQFMRFESLLFYRPHYIEWYHPFIIPNQHYIEIADDYSDLAKKVTWAMENDKQIGKMVKETSKFAFEYLSFQDMECYFFRLLQKYKDLVEIPKNYTRPPMFRKKIVEKDITGFMNEWKVKQAQKQQTQTDTNKN